METAQQPPELKLNGTSTKRALDTTPSDYGFKKGNWEFNGNVAGNWKSEMFGHIPGYSDVLETNADLVYRIHGNTARILVFWMAKGKSVEHYVKLGWSPSDICAINYSKPLNDALAADWPQVKSMLVDVKDRPANACSPEFGGRCSFDVVQMPWSLHFEAVEDRLKVMQQVFAALKPGGTYLLTEKTRQPSAVEAAYHDFKRTQGVPDDVIATKKKAIQGVLETLPSKWYEDNLLFAGFEQVVVVHAKLGFVTWMCRKPHNP